MKHTFLAITFACIATLCTGQQEAWYTQYMHDPYLINPSMLAMKECAEVNILYNRQWTGVKNSPQTYQTDIQFPLSTHIAMGVQLIEDRTVILSKTSTVATFGYKTSLSPNQSIGFGLSGGLTNHQLHLEEISNSYINDPALYNYPYRSAQFQCRFGAFYQYKTARLGVTLPELVNTKTYYTTSETPHSAFSPFKHLIVHGSWKFPMAEDISIQPNMAYQFHSPALSFYDIAVLFSYKNIIEAGGGHHKTLGSHAIIRFDLGSLDLGYAFGFGGTGSQTAALGSRNEIQIKYLFKKTTNTRSLHSEMNTDLYKEYNKRLKRQEHLRKKYRRMNEL